MNDPKPLVGGDAIDAQATADFDPDQLTLEQQYKLLVGSVVPRPIALVSTLGAKGANAAPFSFFNAFAVDPPTIAFSASPRDGVLKDTIRNIQESGEFVVHIVDDAQRERMNICAIEYGAGVNEIAESGFTPVPSLKVKPPRLAECPIQMECRLVQIVKLGRRPYDLVIGEVVYFHFRPDLVDARQRVDAVKLNALGRLAGYDGYVRTTDRISMPRLPVPPGKPAA